MTPDTFACPECGVRLRRSATLSPGATVQCPKCSTQFPVPSEEVRTESEPLRNEPPDFLAAWKKPKPDEPDDRDRDERVSTEYDDLPRRPLAPIPEDEDYPRHRLQIGQPEDLPEDYRVDLGEWFAIANTHYNPIMGASAGFQILFFFITQAAGAFAGALAQLLINPPLGLGQTLVCLSQLKGQRWQFGDFFGGFKYFGQTVLLTLLNGALSLVVLIPAGIVFIFLLIDAQGDPAMIAPAGWFALLGVGLVSLIPLIYLSIRINFFAPFLFIDRRYPLGDAIRGSWRLTRGHVLELLWVTFVLGAINFGGLLLCGVGLLFTIPYTTLVQSAGYLLVAGTESPLTRDELEHRFPDEDLRSGD